MFDEHDMVSHHDLKKYRDAVKKAGYNFNKTMYEMLPAKIQTIREDKKNRWKAGNLIHAVIFNRTTKQVQFVPTFTCKRVDKIIIQTRKSWMGWDIKITINDVVFIEIFKNKTYSVGDANYNRLKEFSVNDGFDTVTQFVEYFAGPVPGKWHTFKGKLIHFTNHSYID